MKRTTLLKRFIYIPFQTASLCYTWLIGQPIALESVQLCVGKMPSQHGDDIDGKVDVFRVIPLGFPTSPQHSSVAMAPPPYRHGRQLSTIRIGCHQCGGKPVKHPGAEIRCSKTGVLRGCGQQPRPSCKPVLDECLVDECLTESQYTVLMWYGFAAVMLALFGILAALAATEVLRSGETPLSILSATEKRYAEPAQWVWAVGFLLMWLWLAGGLAVGASIAYRTHGVEYVMRGMRTLAIALAFWSAAVVSWMYEETAIAATVLLFVALLLLTVNTFSLYLGKQIPPYRVVAFWISGMAFAAGWTLVATVFSLEVAVGSSSQTSIIVIISVMFLLFGTLVGLRNLSIPFLLMPIIAISTFSELGASSGVGIVFLITLIVWGIVALVSLWMRYFTSDDNGNDGRTLYISQKTGATKGYYSKQG